MTMEDCLALNDKTAARRKEYNAKLPVGEKLVSFDSRFRQFFESMASPPPTLADCLALVAKALAECAERNAGALIKGEKPFACDLVEKEIRQVCEEHFMPKL
ncbi:hypothetical protein BGX29_009371 [Mortierella sp. GBA35]|nr:hypothetical protein BGX29_009371 [Mortierella sp. GBA35]